MGLFSIVIHLFNVLDWQESRTELESHPALGIDLSPVQVETGDNISVEKLLRVMDNIHSKKYVFIGGDGRPIWVHGGSNVTLEFQ